MDVKENEVVLFLNKKTKETQPDYKGQVNIGGKVMDIALWQKTAKTGTPYLSGKIAEPFKKNEQGMTVHPNLTEKKNEDGLPF